MPDISSLQSYAINAANNAGIDPTAFLWQIGQESSWNPNAQNGNATGIAQFMPRTAAGFGIDPTNPYQSLDAAAQFDATLLNGSCNGDYACAFRKYGTLANVPGSVMQSFQNMLSGLPASLTGTGAGTQSGSAPITQNVSISSDAFVLRIGFFLLGIVMVAGAIYTYKK